MPTSAFFVWKQMVLTVNLTFTTLWDNSADDKLMIVFLFTPENRFDITYKLSP